jgi:hypothetical protein
VTYVWNITIWYFDSLAVKLGPYQPAHGSFERGFSMEMRSPLLATSLAMGVVDLPSNFADIHLPRSGAGELIHAAPGERNPTVAGASGSPHVSFFR